MVPSSQLRQVLGQGRVLVNSQRLQDLKVASIDLPDTCTLLMWLVAVFAESVRYDGSI